MTNDQKNWVIGSISIILLVLFWEYAYFLDVGKIHLFPSPSVFLGVLFTDDYIIGIGSQATSIPKSIAASFMRVFVGLFISFISALVVGLLFHISPLIRRILLPVVRILSPLAPIVWIPLALVLFGITNMAAIFIVFMGVFFMLTIATLDALENVPQRYIIKAKTRGASDIQIWYLVKIPYIIPKVFMFLRINFIAAWMSVLAAEMTGLQDGLGGIIMTGRNLYNNEMILLGMFLIGFTGFAIDILLQYIQRTFFWWSNE